MPAGNISVRRWFIVLICVSALGIWMTKSHNVSAQAVPFDTGQVSVTGSATGIVPPNGARTGLLITNPGTVAVYLGNSASVSSATGTYLPGGASINLPTRAPVYGISSGASQTVTFLETFERLP